MRALTILNRTGMREKCKRHVLWVGVGAGLYTDNSKVRSNATQRSPLGNFLKNVSMLAAISHPRMTPEIDIGPPRKV